MVDERTIEAIESTEGLREALEVVGHAGMTAHDEGRCIIEFWWDEETESMTISEITQHVEILESDAE